MRPIPAFPDGLSRRLVPLGLTAVLVAVSLIALRPTPARAFGDGVPCLSEFATRWGPDTIGGAQAEASVSLCDRTAPGFYTYRLTATMTGPGYDSLLYDGDGNCGDRLCYIVGSSAGPLIIGNLWPGKWTLTLCDWLTYDDPEVASGHTCSAISVHIDGPPTPGPVPTDQPAPLPTDPPAPPAPHPTPRPTARPKPVATAVATTTAEATPTIAPSAAVSPSAETSATASAPELMPIAASPSQAAIRSPDPVSAGHEDGPPSAVAPAFLAFVILSTLALASVAIRRRRTRA